MKSWYLIAYDIRDDKRLKHIARVMEGYGRRMQYSIFRCYLSRRDLERLQWELSKHLAEDDGLLTIELCRACVNRVRARGGADWPKEPPDVAIL